MVGLVLGYCGIGNGDIDGCESEIVECQVNILVFIYFGGFDDIWVEIVDDDIIV